MTTDLPDHGPQLNRKTLIKRGSMLVAGATLASATEMVAPAWARKARVMKAGRATATITIAGATNYSMIPPYLAREKGWWSGAGLDVSPTTVASSSAAVSAVVSGSVNIATTNLVVFWQGTSQGLPITAIAPTAGQRLGTSGIFTTVSKGIKTAKQLEGKTYSLASLRGTNELDFRVWMTNHGADPNKVNLVALPQATILSTLQSGSIDASFINAPFNSQALQNPGTFVQLGEDDNAVAPYGTCLSFWFANSDWVKNNGDAAAKVAKILVNAGQYVNHHPVEAKNIQTLPDFLGVTQAVAQASVIGAFSPSIPLRWMQTIADAATKWGLFTQSVSVPSTIWTGAKTSK
jgi:NitT/TauT family transport system substrate-binding protein